MAKWNSTLYKDKSTIYQNGIGMMTRTFLWLSMGTLCLFILLGMTGLLQTKFALSPVYSMKGVAASLSSQFFLDMVSMEVPHLHKPDKGSSFSQRNVGSFIFQYLTNVNPQDPKSLLAREVTGMNKGLTFLLQSASGTDATVLPTDYTPSQHVLEPVSEVTPIGQEPIAEPEPVAIEDPVQTAVPTPTPVIDSKPALTTNGEKVVFIYNTHNRESWLPEISEKQSKQLNDAYDPDINVTLLSQRLAEQLEDAGIGAVASDVDYPSVVKEFNYNFSYKYSLKTVQEAFAVNPNLTYYFDIHRDSQKRSLTTATIEGIDYAQIFLIVGLKNEHWEKNKAFADKINESLERKLPGISKGTYNKPINSGNAEYNQSFSPNSILIEVGGPENTLEECYRTMDALAAVIKEIYWEAEKVQAPQ